MSAPSRACGALAPSLAYASPSLALQLGAAPGASRFRVHEAIRRASQRVGGTGIRYLVSVNGREKYLFYEGPRWFVEEVAPDEPRPSS